MHLHTVNCCASASLGCSSRHCSYWHRLLVVQASPSRSGPSVYGRSVRLADIKVKRKHFQPPEQPFVVDKQLEKEFMDENYGPRIERNVKAGQKVRGNEVLSAFDTGRRWGEGLGIGVGTLLMSATWCARCPSCHRCAFTDQLAWAEGSSCYCVSVQGISIRASIMHMVPMFSEAMQTSMMLHHHDGGVRSAQERGCPPWQVYGWHAGLCASLCACQCAVCWRLHHLL